MLAASGLCPLPPAAVSSVFATGCHISLRAAVQASEKPEACCFGGCRGGVQLQPWLECGRWVLLPEPDWGSQPPETSRAKCKLERDSPEETVGSIWPRVYQGKDQLSQGLYSSWMGQPHRCWPVCQLRGLLCWGKGSREPG